MFNVSNGLFTLTRQTECLILVGMNTDGLNRAIQFFGSQQALAAWVGLGSSMAISQWKKRGVPAKYCQRIQLGTNNKITVHDLRPDIFGPPDEHGPNNRDAAA